MPGPRPAQSVGACAAVAIDYRSNERPTHASPPSPDLANPPPSLRAGTDLEDTPVAMPAPSGLRNHDTWSITGQSLGQSHYRKRLRAVAYGGDI